MGRWMEAARAMASEAEKLPPLARRELTEPTKPGSVSFVSSDLEEITNFPGAATSRPTMAGNLSAYPSGEPADAHGRLSPCVPAPFPSDGGAAGETPPKLSNALKCAANLREEYEERAAILEYEAGLPKEWAEHFARLIVGGPPGDFSPTRWQAALDAALRFADKWALEAHRLGWEVSEVFGLHPTAPAGRVDCRGLAWLLGDGSEVVAMDRSGAEIRKLSGGRQRYYRRRPEDWRNQ